MGTTLRRTVGGGFLAAAMAVGVSGALAPTASAVCNTHHTTSGGTASGCTFTGGNGGAGGSFNGTNGGNFSGNNFGVALGNHHDSGVTQSTENEQNGNGNGGDGGAAGIVTFEIPDL